MKNYIRMEFSALSENENFARSAVAAFALPLNPTLAEISDIKTVVSEGVTNCIVHAYKGGGFEHKIVIECDLQGDQNGGVVHITIIDEGCGIEDVEQAMQPFFSTALQDERSGMGLTIMQTFTDEFSMDTKIGKGTKISMSKKIGAKVGEC